MRFRLAVLTALAAVVTVPGTASASEIIDRNASNISLKVAKNGQALVSYNARGKRWNVLAWGALNAIHGSGIQARPDQARLYGGPVLSFMVSFENGFTVYTSRAVPPPPRT